MGADLARCYRCGEERPVGEFARDASKASGRKRLCKACDNARSRDYYSRNRERVLARVLAARGRVSPHEAVCAGCGERFMASGRQRYCEPSCRPASGATVITECERCGEPFEARARDRAKGLARFCGKSCAIRFRHAARAAVRS